MDCYFFAIAGIAFLGGSIMTLSLSEKQRSKIHQVFSKDLANKYERIVMERRTHYLIGLSVGMLISFSLIYTFSKPLSYFYHIIFFLTITLGIALIIYFLMPKSDYMSRHLKTKNEIQLWSEINNEMKYRYMFGVLLGIVAAVLFASVLC